MLEVPGVMEEVMDRRSAKALEPQQAADALPFDRALALSRVEGDEELLGELARLFLAELPGMLERLRAAVSEKSPSAVASEGHALKGAVANFGAARATNLAFSIERMGRQENLTGAEDEFRELEIALDALTAALTKVVNEPALSRS